MLKKCGLLFFICAFINLSVAERPLNGISVNSLTRAGNTKIDYRLPSDTKPVSYKIKLTPNIVENAFTFTGEVDIEFKVEKATKRVTFHIEDITIIEDKIKIKSTAVPAEPIEVVATIQDEIKNFYTIVLKNELKKDSSYILSLSYGGNLNDELRGFYRSSYKDKNGKQVYLATTHFEPTSARRAFPCWDEPALKATFEISILHLPTYTALSNTKVLKSEPDTTDKTKILTQFEKTPIMSTYLVAFVVSDFGKVSTDKFNVYARPDMIDAKAGDFALDFGVKALKALEGFTVIPFEIPKMDQIAIPDFSAGAMENWGLVTYRETSLLYEEGVSTTFNKENIASTIAHEFAHQWFGNLVTLDWWKYTWLNEGFANYFQYFITNQIEPSWRRMDQIVVQELQNKVFDVDAKIETHPINNEVSSSQEISTMFDTISYSKGGSVIRMMSQILTEKVFQKGLQEYLKKNNYKATTSDNLFDDIYSITSKDEKEASFPTNIKLADIMNTWVNQPGYPVVTVTRDYKQNTATLKQTRFFSADRPLVSDEKWYIPVTYTLQNAIDFTISTPRLWMEPKKDASIPKLEADQWIIVNVQQTGVYRVNYDEENWKMIIKHLKTDKFEQIHLLNRAQMIDDALNLARAGLVDYQIALDLTSYLIQEVDYAPWSSAFNAFTFLNDKLVGSDSYPSFQKYVLQLSEKFVKSVGFDEKEKEDHIVKRNRVNAMKWACTMGSSDCKKQAHEKLKNWLEDPKKNKISLDLRAQIGCYGMYDVDEDTWGIVFDKAQKEENQKQKSELINWLGCSQNAALLEHYLSDAIKKTSKLNAVDVVKSVANGSPMGAQVAVDFIFANIKKLIELDESPEKNNMKTYLSLLGGKIKSEDEYKKLVYLPEIRGLKREVTEPAKKLAEANVVWINSHRDKVGEWLRAKFEKKSDNSAGTVTFNTILLFVSAITLFTNFMRIL